MDLRGVRRLVSRQVEPRAPLLARPRSRRDTLLGQAAEPPAGRRSSQPGVLHGRGDQLWLLARRPEGTGAGVLFVHGPRARRAERATADPERSVLGRGRFGTSGTALVRRLARCGLAAHRAPLVSAERLRGRCHGRRLGRREARLELDAASLSRSLAVVRDDKLGRHSAVLMLEDVAVEHVRRLAVGALLRARMRARARSALGHLQRAVELFLRLCTWRSRRRYGSVAARYGVALSPITASARREVVP